MTKEVNLGQKYLAENQGLTVKPVLKDHLPLAIQIWLLKAGGPW